MTMGVCDEANPLVRDGTAQNRRTAPALHPRNARLDERGIDTAIIFRETVIDLPQVRTVSASGRTWVYVEMPLIENLYSSPLAQRALLDIIKLAINPDLTD